MFENKKKSKKQTFSRVVYKLIQVSLTLRDGGIFSAPLITLSFCTEVSVYGSCFDSPFLGTNTGEGGGLMSATLSFFSSTRFSPSFKNCPKRSKRDEKKASYKNNKKQMITTTSHHCRCYVLFSCSIGHDCALDQKLVFAVQIGWSHALSLHSHCTNRNEERKIMFHLFSATDIWVESFW